MPPYAVLDQPEFRAHFVPHPTYPGRQNAALQQAQRAAQATKSRVQQANHWTAQQNRQLATALTELTGVRLEANPRRWWDWWANYVDQHPPQRYAAIKHHAYLSQLLLPRPHGSLAKGTEVWTHLGPRPIETLQVGDLVLAQDPATQSLVYKPVIRVSRSVQPTRVIRLSGGGAVRCAPGCAFWRPDHGWWQARDLKQKCLLRSLNGDQEVSESTKLIEGEVFALAIAELSNLVVGKSGVLVHDISAPSYGVRE